MKASLLFVSLILTKVMSQDKVNLTNYTISSASYRCGSPEGLAVLGVVSKHRSKNQL